MEKIEIGDICTIRIGTDYYGNCKILKNELNNRKLHVLKNEQEYIFTKRKNEKYFEIGEKSNSARELLLRINKTYGDPNF